MHRPIGRLATCVALAAILSLASACTRQLEPTPTPTPDPPGSTAAWYVGKWVGTDDDGWTYTLTVLDETRFVQVIDQGPDRQCEQRGTWWARDGVFGMRYAKNTCNEDYEGRSVDDPIVDLREEGFGLDNDSYVIRYERAP